MKEKILKVAGFIILVCGLFVFFIGLGMYFEKDKDDSDHGLPIAVASSAIIIPGIILLVTGISRERRIENEQMASIYGITKSYRRIAIADIAEKLDMQVKDVYRLLSKGISKRRISGYIDRSSNEFFTVDALDDQIDVKFCPSCGAPIGRVLLKGEKFKCKSCGTVIK